MLARPCCAISSRARIDFLLFLAGCLFAAPGCSTTNITITASPASAEIATGETQTVTAVITGTSDSHDREVIWSVCNGQGENCVNGGNSTVGIVAPFMSGPSSGDPTVVYTAPSSVPSPPACRSTSDGCAVVVRGQLAHFDAACFSTITILTPVCTRGVVERISVTAAGAQVTGPSEEPFISGDGRFIGFHSFAADLVSGDTNGARDVFIRDTCRGAVGCTPSVTRVSVSTGGTEANGPSNGDGDAISADGRFVAFESDASNLVSGDTNNATDIYVRDTCFGATGGCTPSTIRVSVDSTGAQGSAGSFVPTISATGRFVVFESDAAFETFDTNGSTDIYVRDTCFGATGECAPSTTLISIGQNEGPEPGNGPSNLSSDGSPISDEGRFIVFQSLANNLVAVDTNFTSDIFLRDTCVGATSCSPSTTLISRATGGAQGIGFSEEATMDGTGRFITFGSFSNNLVSGDANGTSDIFLRDTMTSSTTLISVATGGGVGNNTSFSGVFSRNGRFIAFDSSATNLDSASDTNGDFDVFVRDTCFGVTGGCTPTTIRVPVSSVGSVGNAISHVPAITDDGRFVAFESGATNLITGDTNAALDIYLAQTCFVP